jgi:uncharacterized protein with PIN domain
LRPSSEPKEKHSVSERPGGAKPINAQQQNVATKSARLIVCPHCDGRNVRPSHLKNIMDKALSSLFISPYRCRECRHRFWKIK